MKPIIMAFSILLAVATAAFGTDWKGRLPAGTSDTVIACIADIIRAGVDPDTAVTLTHRMGENRFAESHMLRAYEIIMAAQREGLPVGPLVNKVHEGMAKKVEPERIVQAMEAVRSRYSLSFQQAKVLIAEEKQQRELGQTMAEGLAAGILARDLTRITENIRKQSRQFNDKQAITLSLISFQVARDMARFGVLSETLTNVVCRALQSHFTTREMEQMQNSFINEARYGKAEAIAHQFYLQIGSGARAGLGSSIIGAGLGAEGGGEGGGGGAGGAGGAGGSGGGGMGGGGGY